MSEIRGAATESTLRRVATLLGNGYSDPVGREIRGAATEETLLRIEAAISGGGGGGGGGGGETTGIDLGITGATVGQYPQVAAVDADGKPTEWTAANEYTLPVMSADVRGGAKIQPNSGLEITDTDNLQVRLALESDGDVRGGIAQVTAKGHAEQVQTTGKNLLPNTATSQTVNGVTFTVNADGSVTVNGTASTTTQVNLSYNNGAGIEPNTTYVLSGCPSGGGSTSYWLRASDDITSAKDDTGESIAFSYANVESFYVCIRIISGTTLNNVVFCPQLELGSTATEYEPYSGGAPSPSPDYPQEIQVVRGRNLVSSESKHDGYYVDYGTNAIKEAAGSTTYVVKVKKHTDYVLTFSGGNRTRIAGIDTGTISDGTPCEIFYQADANYTPRAFNSGNHDYVAFTTNNAQAQATDVQLTLGSTPTPYVPYGHVGMEVRDANDQLLSTTPIPLPQRGWVAGLRDGTADSLRLDGAGKVMWTLPTSELTFDGSSDEDWNRYNGGGDKFYFYYSIRSGTNPRPLLMSNRYTFSQSSASPIAGTFIANGSDTYWNGNVSFFPPEEVTEGDMALWREFLSSNPVTVLYPLATPVTEDCGYVKDWPTDIPEGATVTIPELDALGIRYFVDSVVTELARQWHDRTTYERTIATQDALASVAPTEHSPAESNHSVGELITYQGALYRVTVAIARGESITIGTNVTATTVAEQLAALQ